MLVQVDLAFYPPWDGKMSASFLASYYIINGDGDTIAAYIVSVSQADYQTHSSICIIIIIIIMTAGIHEV